MVSTGSTAQEHTVRMEGGGSERSGLVALEEARVGLDAGDFLPVKVKDLDEMGGGATVESMSQCSGQRRGSPRHGRRHLHSKDRQMLMRARRPQHVLGGLERLERLLHADIPQVDLAVATSRQELALAAALHVH